MAIAGYLTIVTGQKINTWECEKTKTKLFSRSAPVVELKREPRWKWSLEIFIESFQTKKLSSPEVSIFWRPDVNQRTSTSGWVAHQPAAAIAAEAADIIDLLWHGLLTRWCLTRTGSSSPFGRYTVARQRGDDSIGLQWLVSGWTYCIWNIVQQTFTIFNHFANVE